MTYTKNTIKNYTVNTPLRKEMTVEITKQNTIKNGSINELHAQTNRKSTNVITVSKKNTVTTKKFQTLLDRFRRKPNQFTLPKMDNVNDIDIQETIYDEKEIDNSMEKLRVDEETRTKIFHDFSTTVSKYPDKNITIDTDSSKVTVADEIDNSTGINVYGTLLEDIFGDYNESSVSQKDRPTPLPSYPPTSVMKTPMPRIDGKQIAFYLETSGVLETSFA